MQHIHRQSINMETPVIGVAGSPSLDTQENPDPPHQHPIDWSDGIEMNVKEIGEMSKGYKIMHMHEARLASFKYSLLMYLGMSLGPACGLLSILPESYSTGSYITGVVSFASGIVVAISKYGKYEEKRTSHHQAASKYTSLESNVRRQLLFARKDRVEASQYLDWIGISFDELFNSSPMITSMVYNSYAKVARKSGLVVPDEYGITISDEVAHQGRIGAVENITAIVVNKSPKSSITSSHNIDILPRSPLTRTKHGRTPDGNTFTKTPDIYASGTSRKNRGSKSKFKLSPRSIALKFTRKDVESDECTGKHSLHGEGLKSAASNVANMSEIHTFSDGRMEYELARMRKIHIENIESKS